MCDFELSLKQSCPCLRNYGLSKRGSIAHLFLTSLLDTNERLASRSGHFVPGKTAPGANEHENGRTRDQNILLLQNTFGFKQEQKKKGLPKQ